MDALTFEEGSQALLQDITSFARTHQADVKDSGPGEALAYRTYLRVFEIALSSGSATAGLSLFKQLQAHLSQKRGGRKPLLGKENFFLPKVTASFLVDVSEDTFAWIRTSLYPASGVLGVCLIEADIRRHSQLLARLQKTI